MELLLVQLQRLLHLRHCQTLEGSKEGYSMYVRGRAFAEGIMPVACISFTSRTSNSNTSDSPAGAASPLAWISFSNSSLVTTGMALSA